MQISQFSEFNGPFLTGNESLAESDKKILEHTMGEPAILNVFNLAISKGIESACNSTEITQKVCTTIGKNLSEGTQTVIGIAEDYFPETMQGIKHAFSTVLKIPSMLKGKYGIPEEVTNNAFESSMFIVPLIGAFKFAKITKIDGIRKATLHFLKDDCGSLLPKKPRDISSKKMIAVARKAGYSRRRKGGAC
jgi:hypothetical protein